MTRYKALALQTACYAVNSAKNKAEANAMMHETLDRIEAQILGSKAFVGQKLKLVVLPEYFLTGFPMGETLTQWRDKACVTQGDEICQKISAIASKTSTYISGNFYEIDENFSDIYFQTSFIVSDEGEFILRYRRLNSMFAPTPHDVWDKYLAIYGYESLFPVAKTPLGNLACIASEEILYPEIARCLMMRGAEVFLHSSSEVCSPQPTPKNVGKQARALENMAYLVSANSAGMKGISIPENSTDGHSQVVHYEGNIIIEAGQGETMVANANIDIEALRYHRQQIGMSNYIARQRFELYAESYAKTKHYPANNFPEQIPDRSHFVKIQQSVIDKIYNAKPQPKQAEDWAANPRTGQLDYQYKSLKNNELESLSQNIRTQQNEWFSNGVAYRVEAMQAWKKALQTHQEDIIAALTQDTGRKSESILEMNLLLSSIDRWCAIATDFFAQKETKSTAIPFITIQQELVPYQLVGVISPWNFPLLLSVIDTIPALLCGSAVIVKPSEVTPRFIEPIAKSIADVPALQKIFSYVAGNGQTGENLLQHIDLVCFTGSVATGKKVYAAMAAQLKPCFLELGGKDAALIFEGANLDNTAQSILWGSCVNCGHSCLSIERVYVEKTIFDDFLTLLIEKAKQIKLAYPTVDDGQIGPVISIKQVEIINEHLRDALAKGAKIEYGNAQCEEIDGGFWCRPTILSNVNHSMKIMTEETFGPIIPVMPFDNAAEAIALANATIFGLSGAVFSESVEKSAEIAQKMEAGAISLNDCALTAIIHDGEKNAFRQSGIGGTRMGPAAIKRFMRQKALIMKNEVLRSPWWF